MNNSKNRSLPQGAFVNINIPTSPSENKVANSVLFVIEIYDNRSEKGSGWMLLLGFQDNETGDIKIRNKVANCQSRVL